MNIEVKVLAVVSAVVLTAFWVGQAGAIETLSDVLVRFILLIVLVAIAWFVVLQTMAKSLQKLTQQAKLVTRQTNQSSSLSPDSALLTLKPVQAELRALGQALSHSDAALSLSNAALTQAIATKERMETELETGRQIQMNLLTLTFPSFPKRDNLDLYATLKPAREMSGDFYDFYFYREGKSYLLEANRLCFCVGDVSGKGVPAALFMAVTKILLKSQADKYSTPSTILSNVNQGISADNPSCMFVTLFFGVLNLINGELVYTNAGHNPPYLRHQDGTLEHLNQRHGPALGVAEDFAYRESRIRLSANDMLIIFTDGVTEAMDREQNIFSEQRLVTLLESNAYQSAEDVVHLTTQAVSDFQGEAEQADDITLLSLKFLGQPEVAEGETWERLIRKEILSSLRE